MTVRKMISSGASDRLPFADATRGLIAMKGKNFEAGDQLYESAIAQFTKGRMLGHTALCLAYYARAASDCEHPDSAEIFARAVAAVRVSPSTDANLLLAQGDFSGGVAREDALSGVRRLSQWVFDPVSNEIVRRSGVTKKGAPPFVVVPARGPVGEL